MSDPRDTDAGLVVKAGDLSLICRGYGGSAGAALRLAQALCGAPLVVVRLLEPGEYAKKPASDLFDDHIPI